MRSTILVIIGCALVPILATIFFSWISARNRKNEAAIESVSFIVRESRITVVIGLILIILGSAFFALLLYLLLFESGFWDAVQDAGVIFTAIIYLSAVFLGTLLIFLPLGIGIGSVYSYYHKRIIVEDKTLTYYSTFQKGQRIELSEITKLEEQPVGFGQKVVVAYSNQSRLFQFDSTNVGYSLLVNRLQREKIFIEEFQRQNKP